ncbi:MAG: hypothetical protein M1828_000807 [Chrysothrix sp. TS-e1954]|nr:MAG: hypothetical protein M1828_000807 [Chrysothrix sp. TS-e1954]
MADAAATDAAQPGSALEQPQDKPRYKSYRKKYRKMKLLFDHAMDECTDHFRVEQKTEDIAKRLREQNDQLLELLLEINETKRVSRFRYFDISSTIEPPSESKKSKSRTLQKLEREVTHTHEGLPSPAFLPRDFQEMLPPSYLTPEQEDKYLDEVDRTAATPLIDMVFRHLRQQNPMPTPWTHEKRTPTDRDFALSSSISVHNWLRRNQPQAYDAQGNLISNAKDGKPDRDKDKDSERGSVRSPPPRRSTAKKEKAVVKQDHDYDTMDEENGVGTPTENGVGLGSGKGKRKRDDGAYRPGGRGSRSAKSSKRKRDRGEEGEGRSKKRKVEDQAGVADNLD